jgi:hypothetical protein
MRIFAVLFVVLLCGVAEAKPRRTYTYSTPTYSTSTPVYEQRTSNGSSDLYSGSDQDRCQAEANYMASRGITGHVGSCIGSFEGVGYGGSPNCNTCTPGRGMNLTGDASSQGRNGMWYRVRSWR